VGQERLGPSYVFIPLVLGPPNRLVWYVPSLRYTRGLGWRMHCGVEVTESSANKQHHPVWYEMAPKLQRFILLYETQRSWYETIIKYTFIPTYETQTT